MSDQVERATSGPISKSDPMTWKPKCGDDGQRSALSWTNNMPEPPVPIAIVGIGMRLPGNVRTARDFWATLMEKKDGLCPVPPGRYKPTAFESRDCPLPKNGYFLQEDPAYFDAAFFAHPAQEAGRIDPQTRLLHEVVWECLENAGEVDWEGKAIGCFVGAFGEDWLSLSHKDPQDVYRCHAVGTGPFALANLLSHKFNLRGPSMTIETACSASLTSLHVACLALAAHDCSAAIVAGASLILSPTMTTVMSRNMVLSPSGICRAFDASADGYGRGEAINALYVKRLDDALREGSPIRAIIKSTASNSDGGIMSIGNPSPGAQASLIRTAYRKARIGNIGETGLFECHGTGTIAGDTAEAKAIADVLQGQGTVLGAVKSNFGHSEGASGLTSLIKAILSLEKRTIPPNAHVEVLNPQIPFEQEGLIIPQTPMPWPGDRQLRASINGFGIGGANVHVIIEAPMGVCLSNSTAHDRIFPASDLRLLVASAHDQASLKERVRHVTDYLKQYPGQLQDLAFTLGTRRQHLACRAFALARQGEAVDPLSFRSHQTQRGCLVHFVFTGQGAHWAGMGKSLVDRYPSVREDLQTLQQALAELEDPPSWTLQGEICNATSSQLPDTEVCQTLCTAVQIALVNLFATWGVLPHSVVGHSSGELAAAYSAGAITAQSAIIAAYYRGRLVKEMAGVGEMASIGLSREEVEAYLENGVVIACENSANSVTISGDTCTVDAIVDRVRAERPEKFCRKLQLTVAYHSPQIAHLGPRYVGLVSKHLQASSSCMIPMFSTVTGKMIVDASEIDAAYFRKNLESPVLFSAAVQSMLRETESGHLFIEIGPHSALSSPLGQIFQHSGLAPAPEYVPTLISNVHDCESQLLAVVGHMHIRGFPVGLMNINGPGNVVTELDPYPWQHTVRHWHESRLVRDWRLRETRFHELLGARCLESTEAEPVWRNVLRLGETPWLSEHVLQNQVIFPGAGYIAMAGEAIRQVFPDSLGYSLRNIIFRAPMILEESSPVEVLTSLKPIMLNDVMESDWYTFSISTHDGRSWTKNCSGQVRPGERDTLNPVTFDGRPCCRPVSSARWYRTLANLGLSYGPQFRGLKDILADPNGARAVGTATDNAPNHANCYAIHPTVIDQCLQLIGVAAAAGLVRNLTGGAVVPASIEEISIGGGGDVLRLEAETTETASTTIKANARALCENRLILFLGGVVLFRQNQQDPRNRSLPFHACVTWKPDIDFQAPKSLLRKPHMPASLVKANIRAGATSLLCILQAHRRVQAITPQSPHIARWKEWLATETSKIAKGQYHHLYPGSASWAEWTDDQMIGRLQELSVEIACLSEGVKVIVEAIEAILRSSEDLVAGKVTALPLLLAHDHLGKIYTSLMRRVEWGHFLSLLCHSNPHLRVIEIGAGTGGSTASILKALKASDIPQYSQYMFTDITPGFLGPAQEKFRDQPNMQYKTLDITRDPCEQGFQRHGYDLVIASNVLHATPNLGESLRHVQTLLAPDGHLLLNELSPAVSYINFIMGTLPGWWVGVSEGRTDAPYISPDEWDKRLRAAGFSGVDARIEDMEPPYELSYTMISRVPQAKPLKPRVALLARKPPCSWSRMVHAVLSGLGYQIEWSSLHETPGQADWTISLLDVDGGFLHRMTADTYADLQSFLKNVQQGKILWVTHATQLSCSNPDYALALGLARCLRHESEIPFCTFEADAFDLQSAQSLDYVLCHASPSDQDLECEYCFHEGDMLIGRCTWGELVEEKDRNVRCDLPDMMLDVATPALLDSINWVESGAHPLLGEEEVEVEMHYIGLNFRDIMAVMGFIGTPQDLGIEGSGIVQQVGQRVQHLAPGQAVIAIGDGLFRTRVVINASHCIKLPVGMPLNDGATIASVFMTAIYSLIQVGQLKRGQSVLIHSACGGVGLAAIQISRLIGAEIFATVGSTEKAEYLKTELGIPAQRIFKSRDDSFRSALLTETKGRGVDLVLNSLAGKLLHASWGCVARFGKMVELGKRDFINNGILDLKPFAGNRAFIGVDLTQFNPDNFSELLEQLNQLYSQGKIHPIRPVTTFEAGQVVDAFRLLQRGTHMGKVIVQMPHGKSNIPVSRCRWSVSFAADASYLLVGGFGGIGRAVILWMIENGARYFTILSRSAGESTEDQHFLQELHALGCHILCVPGSVTNLTSVERALTDSPRPVRGILQMSLALKDRVFFDMTYEEWKYPLSCKVQGTWNLHHASAQHPLDFFVVFGSIISVCGRHGQSNYAAANSFLDAFTLYRRQKGLPSAVLSLGGVGDIGYLSREPQMLQLTRAAGICILNEQDVMNGLERAIRQCFMPPETSTDSEDTRMATPLLVGLGLPGQSMGGKFKPLWSQDARFSGYSHIEATRHAVSSSTEKSKIRQFMSLVADNAGILHGNEAEDTLTEEVCRLMTMYTAEMQNLQNSDKLQFPIDSLMSIEIRNWIRHHVELEITLPDISKAKTIDGLVQLVVERLRKKHIPEESTEAGGKKFECEGGAKGCT